MKLIPLTRGKFAKVDDADFEWLNQWNWTAFQRPEYPNLTYAIRSVHPNQHTLYMHRVILGLTNPKVKTDHKNGNGLDNRRSNIRAATSQQNGFNTRIRRDNRSGFKGVRRSEDNKKWVARIRLDGQRHHLGTFNSAKEAAAAYRSAARQAHGEFFSDRK